MSKPYFVNLVSERVVKTINPAEFVKSGKDLIPLKLSTLMIDIIFLNTHMNTFSLQYFSFGL
jgi:hypothetical protein